MKITINKNDIDFDNCRNTGQVLENLVNKIDQILINSNATSIMTCGNIAASLQDSRKYSIIPNFVNVANSHGKPYQLGMLNNLILVVDPFQRWTDNNINIIYDRSTMIALKINKLLKREHIDIIEKIVVDDFVADLL